MQKYRNYFPCFNCACQISLRHFDAQIVLTKNQNKSQSNSHFKFFIPVASERQNNEIDQNLLSYKTSGNLVLGTVSPAPHANK